MTIPKTITPSNLINAKEINIKHPDTFQIPSDLELSNLKIGDIVKICNGSERFWTIVVSIKGDDICARINNYLVNTKEYDYNDILSFKKENVYEIFYYNLT